MYGEWLKLFLGDRTSTEYNLALSSMSVYDKKLDPSVRNEVSGAAFRVGHSMVAHNVSMTKIKDDSVVFTYRVKDNYFQVGQSKQTLERTPPIMITHSF